MIPLVHHPRHSARRALLAACLGLLCNLALTQEPATFLVGSDSVCDFSTIQAAVNAAASHPGPDRIHIAHNQDYTAQAIKVGSQDKLDIVGGFDDCTQALAGTPSGTTVINGLGGDADSVFEFRGSGYRVMSHLGIVGGDEVDSGYGGGIDFKGTGPLELDNLIILNNRAGYGGGIYFESTGLIGNAVLELKYGVVVQGNQAANDGGGVYVAEDSLFYMVDADSTIRDNQALNGSGGGLYLNSTDFAATAYIASPGLGSDGAIARNRARNGGGIAVRAGDHYAELHLFSTSAPRPVRLHGNFASNVGGAIYIVGGDNEIGAVVNIRDFVIEHNEAANGAAIYLDNGAGGSGAFIGFPVDFLLTTAPPSIGCTPRTACNRLDFNVASDTNGAVVLIDPSSQLIMKKATLSSNQGRNLIRQDGNGGGNRSEVSIRDCLLAGNTTLGALIGVAHADDLLKIGDCTIANNAIGGTHVFQVDSSSGILDLQGTIIEQPGKLTVSHPGGTSDPDVYAHFNVLNDVTTVLRDDDHINVPAPPRFVDPEHGDYHLRAGSPAIDFAPPVPGDDRDLDGAPRDQNMAIKPNYLGVRDIGAYERQSIDNLVLNDGFATDLRIWDNLSGAPEAIWSSDDASGLSTSGSVEISLSGWDDLIAMRQCVHLPGPGAYVLDFAGKTADVPLDQMDKLSVFWQYHGVTSNEDCAGPITQGGELFIEPGPGWRTATDPMVLVVPDNEWNASTAVALYLRVQRRPGGLFGNPLFGRFDDVSLTYSTTSDRIFANGFEAP